MDTNVWKDLEPRITRMARIGERTRPRVLAIAPSRSRIS